MKELVFKSGRNPWISFDLTVLQTRPHQEAGSCSGGSYNCLSILPALNSSLLRQPGLFKESRKIAEALVLPAFLLTHLLQFSPCLFSSSFWIATARRRCRASGSSGKVKAAPVHGVEKVISRKICEKLVLSWKAQNPNSTKATQVFVAFW